MDDQQRWDQACRMVHESCVRLSPVERDAVAILVDRIMKIKEEMLAMAIAAGSACICRGCGGKCCLYGKYHFSVLDLMACILSNSEPPVPVFDGSPFCPYGTDSGCSMAPCFRPAVCVLFNCELIDERITADVRERLHNCEQVLRELVRQAELYLNMRVGRPLLLSIQ